MKLKVFLSFLFLLVFFSCGSKKRVVNKKNPGVVIVEPAPVKLPSVHESELIKRLKKKNPKLNKEVLSYISKYAPIAVKEMHEYRIPASITLAQGILESGRGKSKLALKSNNHFGIKCHNKWEGERVYHDDDAIGECFRKYKYPETSYNDHSLFLTNRKRYAFLFDYNMKNYKKWAYGLRKAGYATDKRYPSKLLSIIKKFELYEFDKIEKGSYNRQIKKLNKGKTFVKPVVIEKVNDFYYEVMPDDTLYSISRKFGTSVANLKAFNNLTSNSISRGQKLLVEKGNYTKEINEAIKVKEVVKPVIVKKVKPVFYTVKKGDTLYSISVKSSISVAALKALNNLKDNTISIGQMLLVKK